MFKRLQARLKNRKGFTFIELVVVIAIIAILAAVSMSDVQKTVVSSKESSAKEEIKTVGDAAFRYYTDMGTVPNATSMEQLKTTLTGTADMNGKAYGPWMRKNMKMNDPWGRPYQYTASSSSEFELMSLGASETDPSDDIKYTNL